MKISKSLIKTITFLLITLILCSCSKFSGSSGGGTLFNAEEKAAVAPVATESEVIDTKENLVPLTGDVMTLSSHPLPKIGENVSGFIVKSIYDYNRRNAKVVIFEHEKTGAKAMLMSNDDPDREFCMAFRTMPDDDKGKPHILEHCVLAGSKNYPNANLWNEMRNKTYHSFMNAFTSVDHTYYCASSLSDEQLFSIYKMMIDGIFNPLLLTDKKSFECEGYRYELRDRNDDINLAGVVYYEESGYEGNIEHIMNNKENGVLFPNSYLKYNYGGDTKHIPELTHEELVAFHDKYYHPSNMTFSLFGDINYKEYLEFADKEYLSNYDRKEIDTSDKNYVEKTEFNYEIFDFPVASGSNIEKESRINYLVSMDGMSRYECSQFILAIEAMGRSDGKLWELIQEKLPDAQLGITISAYTLKPYFKMEFSNVDEKDIDVVKDIVEGAFKDLVENGIREDVVEKMIDSKEINDEFERDSHGYSNEVSILPDLSFSEEGFEGFLKYMKGRDDTEKRYRDGSIDNLIKKYLSNNNHSSIVAVVPKAGLLEKNETEKKAKLKEKKEEMTSEEIDSMIKATNEYDAWVIDQQETSLIDKVRTAKVSSLSDAQVNSNVYEENIEGVHFIRSIIDDIKYNHFALYFDTSGVKYEDTLKLQLISQALGFLPTENYKDFEWDANMSRYVYHAGCYPETVYNYNGGFTPYFKFEATSLDKNLDKVMDLYKELMYNTKFDDADKFRNHISVYYNEMKNAIGAYSTDTLLLYTRSKSRKDKLYDVHVNGADCLRYLKEVMDMSDEELLKLMSECRELLLGLYNTDGMVCEIVANYDTMTKIKEKVIELSHDFNSKKIERCDYHELEDLDKKNTAIVFNGTIQYNFLTTALKEDGYEYSAKNDVLSNILSDKIMYQEFRVKRGCYDAGSATDEFTLNMYTFDDPSLKQTYDMYDKIPDMLSNLNLTEEDIEDYKLTSYNKFSYPQTKYEAALSAIKNTMERWNEKRSKRYKKYLGQIKDMKLSDVATCSNIYKKLISDGAKVTVGSKEEIEKNKDLFDEIIYDYVN